MERVLLLLCGHGFFFSLPTNTAGLKRDVCIEFRSGHARRLSHLVRFESIVFCIE